MGGHGLVSAWVRTPRLAFVLLAVLLALVTGSSAGSQIDPGEGEPEQSPAETGVEAAGARTENSRTYRLGESRFATVVAPGPVNYRDAAGKWQPIDTTLVPSDREGFAWESRAHAYKLLLPTYPGREPVRFELGGEWVSFSLRGSAAGRVPTIEKRSARVEAMDGVEVRWVAGNTGLKEELVLAGPQSPSTFVFDLRLSPGLSAHPREDGRIDFASEGTRVFSFAAPFMVDSSDGEAGFSRDVRYELERSDSGQVLRLVAGREWLTDPARVWPVTIDPTVQLTMEEPDDCHIASSPYQNNDQCSFQDLKIGYHNPDGAKRRLLVKFDLGGELPERTITDADLALYCTGGTTGTATTVDLRRITRSWTLDATWSKYNGSNNWTTAGGDFGTTDWATRSGTNCSTVGYKLWTSAGGNTVAGLVNAWLDGTYTNHGMLLKQQTETSNNLLTFTATDDGSNPNQWPELRVEFSNTAPSAPSSLSPADATSSTDPTPTLSGSYSDSDSGDTGVVLFRICSDTDCEDVVATDDASPVGGVASWTTPSLDAGFTYYWQATAFDGVSYTGGADELEDADWTSARSYHVIAAPTNTVLPAISGLPLKDEELTASDGTWTESPSSYAYQWRRCDSGGASCSDISDADDPAYELVGADVGSTIRVVVTATNAAGSTPATSLQTDVIAAPPENTASPTLTGSATERHTLTAATGTWNYTPTRFAYQWSRCDGSGSNCEEIHGAIADVYTLTNGDIAARLKVEVTASNEAGESSAASTVYDAVEPGQAEGNTTYSDKILDSGPASYWGLGETAGTTGAALDQVAGHNGTYHPAINGNTLERGAPGVPIPGTLDEGIRIADVANIALGGGTGNGYVEAPGIAYGGTSSFSVNVWIKWAGYRQWVLSDLTAGIIGNLRNDTSAGGWGLLVPGATGTTGPGAVAFHRKTTGSSPLSSPNTLPIGEWTMITATYDGSTERLFENGIQVASRASTASLSGGYANEIYIGRQDFNATFSGYWGYFEGSIDEPALWTRALTPDEVADLYVPPLELPDGQTFGVPEGPWDCWTFACNPTGTVFDPVNSATGSFITSATDLSLPGIGIPFAFTRTYNSADFRIGVLGQGWTHNFDAGISFDANGNATVRGLDGQQLRFELQPNGSFVDAVGGRSTLEALVDGFEVILHDQTTLSFDSEGRLTSQVDQNGNGLTLDYDGEGRLETVTDAVGREASFTYEDDLLTEVALEDGRSVTFGYNGHLLEIVTDVRDGTTSFEYNGAGRLTKIDDQNNHTVVENTYGAGGRVVEQEDAMGEISTFDWDADSQTLTTTDARGKEWKDVYFGNVLQSRIDPLGNTQSFEYDDDLNLAGETDERGNETTMSYDEAGNMLTRTAPPPLSYEETFTYDGNNDLMSYEDGRGFTTIYEYDGDGNLVETTEPGNRVTEYDYDPDTDLLLSVTDAELKTTNYAYDVDGNLISIERPSGALTTMDHDVSGRMTSRVDPRGNELGATPEDYETTFTYDDANQLLTQTDPLGNVSERQYDPVGNLERVIDAELRETDYVYDAADRLAQVIAPDETVTDYDYDETGNLISRIDAEEHETTHAYDDAGRLESVTAPLGRTWTYAYDENGNRIEVVDANGNATGGDPNDGRTSHEFDELNRLVAIDYSDATPDVTFAYDANGNRIEMADGDGTVTYEYDELDRLETVTRGSDVFGYEYDDVGNVTERTLPGSRIVSYTYTDDRQLDTVSEDGQTTGYAYDSAGNLETTTLPSGNGYVETREHDEAGRLIGIESTKSSTPIFEAVYALDGIGNPEEVTTLSGTETYAYDLLDRLIEVCYQASCPNGNDPFVRYDYDSVGNRLEEERPAGTTTYTYDDADRLTERDGPGGTVAYDYDQNGNQTEAGARTFAYDLANHLVSTTLSGSTIDYTYTGDGVRLEADAGPDPVDITEYLWDANAPLPQLVLERDGSGTPLREYLYGNDQIAMMVSSDPFYYHYDRIGSVTNVTSETGDPQWTYAYEPFGTARSIAQVDPSAPASIMRFAGELYDAETGLYHLRARQYDPANGRFLATDPLSPAATQPYISTYAYANNRPTVLIDPSGMGAVWVDRDGCTTIWCWFGSGNLTASWCAGICLGLGIDGTDLYGYTGCCGLRGGSLTWSPDGISTEQSFAWSGCYYACVGATEDSEGNHVPSIGFGGPGFQGGQFKYFRIR